MLITFGVFLMTGLNALAKQLSTPNITPQIRYFQPAPCQIPLIVKTISVLRYVLNSPFLLPPKGIYIYLVRNLGMVICQRDQKSMTEVAL